MASNITLSAGVRNNLLSLQSTADLMATTQNRLATGKKVNSALDNPTNFFTSQALQSRAGDLSALLDSISNAVKTIEAADNGVTGLTKLVETAQATARQALQTPAMVETTTPAAAATTSSTATGMTAAGLATLTGAGDGDTLVITGGGFSNVSVSFEADGSGDIDTDTATVADLIAEINSQAGATIASLNSDGELTITAANTTDAIVVTDDGDIAGLAGASATPASTSSVANPKREELRNQYNDLLGQIDQLVKDTSFNGVNLLANDSLEVLFNEDGSSKLTIAGEDFDAAGLGLNSTSANDWNANAGINTSLDALKDAVDTLRTSASKFGANLSVVQTRQNFTKSMINTLQTGADNLTLADTNEEAANMLALQTRQQLSSTALSLASQADQAVLRLF